MPAKSKEKNTLPNVRKWLRYLILASNIVAVLLLFMAALAWYIPPSKIGFLAYLGLGFPFILVANILYLICWGIVLRWKFALAQFICIIICWGQISSYFPIHTQTKEVPTDCIKILSYNIRAFNWKTGDEAVNNPILNHLKASGADIICLQEFVADPVKRDGGIVSEEEVAKKLKGYPYHSIVRLGASTTRSYGLACYSKYPILKTTRIQLDSRYNGSVMYDLNINGKTVSLVNNHLESNRITAADKKLYRNFFKSKDHERLDEVANNIHDRLGIAFQKRETQAKTVRETIDKVKSDGIIVCGDFNDTPISYAYKTMKGNLIDSYAKTGLGQGITYHENKFWFRIDYIMHSDNIESYNCTVDTIKASDHYPIWTYLRFKD